MHAWQASVSASRQDTTQDSCRSELLLPHQGFLPAHCRYQFEIVTSDLRGAGTDGTVSLELSGVCDSTAGPWVLDRAGAFGRAQVQGSNGWARWQPSVLTEGIGCAPQLGSRPPVHAVPAMNSPVVPADASFAATCWSPGGRCCWCVFFCAAVHARLTRSQLRELRWPAQRASRCASTMHG